jgi:hypothetical protein
MKRIILKLAYLLIIFLVIFQSCSNQTNTNTGSIPPSELKITTEIIGATAATPTGNGSGIVLFKATANNANSYELLVEGKTLVMPNGQLTYTFTTLGTTIFTATIIAHNADKSISSSTSFTLTVKAIQTAADITKAMGPGFNLGNTFDNGLNPTSITSIKSIIDVYSAIGMKHIRIPVSWIQSVNGSTLANTTTGKVDFTHSRFLELKATIDYALSKDLYVVINSHHEHWLKDYYDGSATYNNKFSALWTDIATYFKSYSNKLIFDVLNEPEGTMGQWGAETGFSFPQPTNSTAISLTRQINKVGYDAIRASGGENTTRIIMIEPNGQGNQGMIEEVYPTKAELPGLGNDKYLVIQVHTYDPWAFCGETGTDSAYPGASSIAASINKVATHSALLGVPINYGEFGVGRTSAARNTSVIYEFYHTVKTTTLANNMSFSVWDDRGWFGLISSADNKATYTLSSNNIVMEMMK